jgi:hypothetical protein
MSCKFFGKKSVSTLGLPTHRYSTIILVCLHLLLRFESNLRKQVQHKVINLVILTNSKFKSFVVKTEREGKEITRVTHI